MTFSTLIKKEMYKGTRQGENLGSRQISIELLATELKLYETAIFLQVENSQIAVSDSSK